MFHSLSPRSPFLVILFVITTTRLGHSVINVEIASIGHILPQNAACLPYAGPAQDVALEEINVRYRGVFNFTLTYIYDASFKTCDDVAYNAAYFLSRWIYRDRNFGSIPAVIGPGVYCSSTLSYLSTVHLKWCHSILLNYFRFYCHT